MVDNDQEFVGGGDELFYIIMWILVSHSQTVFSQD